MTTMQTSRSRRDDHGAQAVEFALLFTFVLGPLLYGLIAFGFILNMQITASQLAREAARSAAICSTQATADAGTCNAVGQARFVANRPAGFGAGVAAVNSSPCFSGAPASATATVSIAPVLPVPGLATIQGRSTTPCGG
ncbi:TadE/TadG family type IV pilus assembly protein [Aeromicrobium sp.]|uniref:TadE/TadG family type IV pilus assembly protein n=1 Tax=Aeromicrobium sp. TaxID=1871063 RepID=UPI002FC70996